MLQTALGRLLSSTSAFQQCVVRQRGFFTLREKILPFCMGIEKIDHRSDSLLTQRRRLHIHKQFPQTIGSWEVGSRYKLEIDQRVYGLRAGHVGSPRYFSLATPMNESNYQSNTHGKVHTFWLGFFFTLLAAAHFARQSSQVASADGVASTDERQDFTIEEQKIIQHALNLQGYVPPVHLPQEQRKQHRLFTYFHAAYAACENGDFKNIKQIKDGKLLNRLFDEYGRSLFVKAVDEGNEELVDKFISAGIGILDPDKEGNTGLHVAARNNNLRLMEKLITKIPFNSRNRDGETPLHLAIKFGHADMAAKLVSRGARDPWISTQNVLFSPLAYAVLHGQVACFEKMMQSETLGHFSIREMVGNGNFLHLAIQSGHTSMLKYLLTEVPTDLMNQPGPQGMPPLHYACYLGSYASVVALISAKVKSSLDLQFRTPIHWAAIGKQPAILERLLKLNPEKANDLDSSVKTPLQYLENRKGIRATECRALLINCIRQLPLQLAHKPNFYHERPTTVTFGGGGVKAVPYPAALGVIQSQQMLTDVDKYGGTSAGSVMAALSAAGLNPEELMEELLKQDFQEFMIPDNLLTNDLFQAMQNKSISDTLWSLVNGYWKGSEQVNSWNPVERARQLFREVESSEGLCDGSHINHWVEGLLKKQTGVDHITFAELHELAKKHPGKYKDVFVFATVLHRGAPSELVCISHLHPEWRDMPIAVGVQASCSYPGVYKPCKGQLKLNNRLVDLTDHETKEPTRFVDGGILFNNPRSYFNRPEFQEGNAPAWGERTNRRTLGLVLENQQTQKPDLNIKGPHNLLFALASTYMHAQQTLSTKFEEDCTIKIMIPQGISAFSKLTDQEKIALAEAGKQAANAFLFPEGDSDGNSLN